MSFKELGVSPFLIEAISNQKFDQPYPIQKKAIPAILNGGDVLGIAPTGSGKTASYVLPILTNLLGKPDLKNRHINALVIVPTRELALQVGGVFQLFGNALPELIRTKSVYGGVSINPQMKSIMGVNILVSTPGRLLDLVENNAVHLSSISSLVLDEADKMLNLGFKEEMNRIFKLLPRNRQNLLFSATLSPAIEEIHQGLLKNPEIIKIEVEQERVELINQSAYSVPQEKKGPLLRYLIRKRDLQQVLVFTSSTYKADAVADKLRKNNIDAQAIHGKKGQGTRRDVLQRFKDGNLRVLVSTDLLSRGIDIEFLPCVINYELPRSPKDYIHRIGRTGRAENPGIAISLVSKDDEHHFKVIQKKAKTWITLEGIEEIDLHGA